MRATKRAATDGFVASKLEMVEWPRLRESMDKMTEDYGEAWRSCPSGTRGALARRRETPGHNVLMVEYCYGRCFCPLHSKDPRALWRRVSPGPYDSGVEQSSHPQKPGVEARTSWALPDANSTS